MGYFGGDGRCYGGGDGQTLQSDNGMPSVFIARLRMAAITSTILRYGIDSDAGWHRIRGFL